MRQKFFAVIGKNFGDEGKGLATDFLCKKNSNTLVVRHNGGAQSGHTVENDGRRFVFHELSSGSFCKADTYWADTYHPDLYKLDEELNDFFSLTGFIPKIFASKDAGITIIDDVLINMALESARGDGRHGSCGMGIYESVLREEAGYKLSLQDVPDLTVEKLKEIRQNYLPKRLLEEGLNIDNLGEYSELLRDENVLINYLRKIKENLSFIKTVSFDEIISGYEQIVFENGQGLLLDTDNKEYYPNVTGSYTGLTNINRLMGSIGYPETLEVLYVTRTYVTRHGAGKLPCECDRKDMGIEEADATNIHNEWQGSIRYAPHESIETFLNPVKEDLKKYEGEAVPNLFVTHLNETGGKLLFHEDSDRIFGITVNECNVIFDKVYLSNGREAESVQEYTENKYERKIIKDSGNNA